MINDYSSLFKTPALWLMIIPHCLRHQHYDEWLFLTAWDTSIMMNNYSSLLMACSIMMNDYSLLSVAPALWWMIIPHFLRHQHYDEWLFLTVCSTGITFFPHFMISSSSIMNNYYSCSSIMSNYSSLYEAPSESWITITHCMRHQQYDEYIFLSKNI